MTEEEYLEECSYSIDKKSRELIIWDITGQIDSISFKNHPHLLDDSSYCRDVMISICEEKYKQDGSSKEC